MANEIDRLLGQILARLSTLETNISDIKQDQKETRKEIGVIKIEIEALRPIREVVNKLVFAILISVGLAIVSLVIK